MAFNTIPSSWIQIGKSLKKELFDYLKSNLDDHETRINNVEQGINKVIIFNGEIIGYINHYSVSLGELTGIGTFKATQDLTITDIKLVLINSSNSPTSSSSQGVLSIDIEKSTDNGVNWNTILVQRPEIGDGVNTTGSTSTVYSFITNGEFVNEGDLLRLNVYEKKDSQGSFLVSVYGELS